jgi:hypothetical protein
MENTSVGAKTTRDPLQALYGQIYSKVSSQARELCEYDLRGDKKGDNLDQELGLAAQPLCGRNRPRRGAFRYRLVIPKVEGKTRPVFEQRTQAY